MRHPSSSVVSGTMQTLGIRQIRIMSQGSRQPCEAMAKRIMSAIVTVNTQCKGLWSFAMLAAGSEMSRLSRRHRSSAYARLVATCSTQGQSRHHRTAVAASRIRASIGTSSLLPFIMSNEVVQSPTNASKCARTACSTGKSLRASPALYAWRWMTSAAGIKSQ